MLPFHRICRKSAGRDCARMTERSLLSGCVAKNAKKRRRFFEKCEENVKNCVDIGPLM